jgi:hypothetical protein
MFYWVHIAAALLVALLGAHLCAAIFAHAIPTATFTNDKKRTATWRAALVLFIVFVLAQILAWVALSIYFANRPARQAAPCRGPRCIEERWQRESGDYSPGPDGR